MTTFLTILLAMTIQCLDAFGFLQAKEPSRQVSDLRARKTGSDWPTFLGPNGNSKSDETSVINPWPDSGLPNVWQKKLLTGTVRLPFQKAACFYSIGLAIRYA